MNEKMNDVLAKLAAPFHPSRVSWRPGAMSGKKDKALALAYADLRAYQNRLDEVCGMDWSVSYTPWSDRIICHLTINGITRSSTGEPDSDSERNENSGSVAEAQAFKRACSMFGLGRYLYSLPATWVEYDAANQRFSDQARARLNGVILQHYERWQNEHRVADLEDTQSEESQEPTEPAPSDNQKLAQMFEDAGRELYGEQWPTVREHNIKRVTGGKPEALKLSDVQTLLNGLKTLRAKRANGVTAK